MIVFAGRAGGWEVRACACVGGDGRRRCAPLCVDSVVENHCGAFGGEPLRRPVSVLRDRTVYPQPTILSPLPYIGEPPGGCERGITAGPPARTESGTAGVPPEKSFAPLWTIVTFFPGMSVRISPANSTPAREKDGAGQERAGRGQRR